MTTYAEFWNHCRVVLRELRTLERMAVEVGEQDLFAGSRGLLKPLALRRRLALFVSVGSKTTTFRLALEKVLQGGGDGASPD